MSPQPIEHVSDAAEDTANKLARQMLVRLGDWDIPTKAPPDKYFKSGCTVAVKKVIRVPLDDQPTVPKIVKRVVRVPIDDVPVQKIVKRVVRKPIPEQLSTDGRPWWVPNEPVWCITCQRFVTLKINGECPSCHFLLAGPDVVPF